MSTSLIDKPDTENKQENQNEIDEVTDDITNHTLFNINNKAWNILLKTRRTVIAAIIFFLVTIVIMTTMSYSGIKKTKDIYKNFYETQVKFRDYIYRINFDVLNTYTQTRVFSRSFDEAQDYNKLLSSLDKNMQDADFYYAGIKNISKKYNKYIDEVEEIGNHLLAYENARQQSIKLGAIDSEAAVKNIIYIESDLVDEVNRDIKVLFSKMNSDFDVEMGKIQIGLIEDSKYVMLYEFAMIILGTLLAIYIYIKIEKLLKYDRKYSEQRAKVYETIVSLKEELNKNLAEQMKIKQKFENSINASNDAIFEVDFKTGECFFSEKWSEIIGVPSPETIDMNLLENWIYKEDRQILRENLTKKNFYDFTVRVMSTDKGLRWLRFKGKWLREFVTSGSLSDVTDIKVMESRVEHMTLHDSLTNMPNRTNFINKTQEAIDYYSSIDGKLCVLYIYLDNYKELNDSNGLVFGDAILIEVSKRFNLLNDPNIFIARFEGNEFLLLIKEIEGPEDIEVLMPRIEKAITSSMKIDGITFSLSFYAGATIFPDDGEDVLSLIRKADYTMYSNKGRKKNSVSFYDRSIYAKILRNNKINNILEEAILLNSVYMHYQSQHDPITGKIVGFEALMRLEDPELGFISPVEFIPIAEKSAVIVALGEWSIHEAIKFSIRLKEHGIEYDNISVNISGVQLKDENFLENVKAIFSGYNVDPSCIHFEITESILLTDVTSKISLLEELRDFGIKIELDDFGTGYSSLNYLRVMPFDVIKVDKCFIDEIGNCADKEILIEFIIDLIHRFNVISIAEGVEKREQLDFLISKNIHAIQGYYFAKPMSEIDIILKYKTI